MFVFRPFGLVSSDTSEDTKPHPKARKNKPILQQMELIFLADRVRGQRELAVKKRKGHGKAC